MTECAKMKLREKLGEISIWTKIKIFYITLIFLSIITLMVNYEDGRNWLLEFHTLNLTSQFDSSVRNMTKYEMVITNITFSLARKPEILGKTRELQDLRWLSRTISGFYKMGNNRFIWKPGLGLRTAKRNLMDRKENTTKDNDLKSRRMDKILNTLEVGLEEIKTSNKENRAHSNNAMPVKRVKTQQKTLAMLGIDRAQDTCPMPSKAHSGSAMPKEKAHSRNAMPGSKAHSDSAMPKVKAHSRNAMPGGKAHSDSAMPKKGAHSRNAMPGSKAHSDNAMPRSRAQSKSAMPRIFSYIERRIRSQDNNTKTPEGEREEENWEKLFSFREWIGSTVTVSTARNRKRNMANSRAWGKHDRESTTFTMEGLGGA